MPRGSETAPFLFNLIRTHAGMVCTAYLAGPLSVMLLECFYIGLFCKIERDLLKQIGTFLVILNDCDKRSNGSC